MSHPRGAPAFGSAVNLGRTIILVAILAGLATLVPRFAPGVIAALVEASAPQAAVSEAPSAHELGRELSLRANPSGHFIVNALVNGHAIEMMVDTGATIVALNEATARRLGIRPGPSDFTASIGTANGVVRAAPVVLAAVSVGGIVVHQVPAAVVGGDALGVNLLGMSFLKRLSKFEMSGGRLSLGE
jgi:aspartyl protease family protein